MNLDEFRLTKRSLIFPLLAAKIELVEEHLFLDS
jgi:hypothetical protein